MDTLVGKFAILKPPSSYDLARIVMKVSLWPCHSFMGQLTYTPDNTWQWKHFEDVFPIESMGIFQPVMLVNSGVCTYDFDMAASGASQI